MGYRIGEVAGRVGMTVEGLRFYERRGLVRPAGRTASGYRVYTDTQVESLRFVRAAQQMGLSLAEIRELLQIRAGSDLTCRTVRARLQEKHRSVRQKLRLLRRFERQLAEAIERCDEEIRRGDGEGCPVLEELGSDLPGHSTAGRRPLPPRTEKIDV